MFQPFSAPYWIVYLLCGISDAADGFLARRLHAETMFGAVLDSTADFLLIAFAALTLLPQLQPAPWMIAWAAGIAALRVTALLVCRIRFHRCAVCHTISNRASGFALFLLPILWRSCGNWLIALPVHATVTVDDFSGKTRVHIAVEPGLFAKRMETRLAAALTTGGDANRKSEGAGA